MQKTENKKVFQSSNGRKMTSTCYTRLWEGPFCSLPGFSGFLPPSLTLGKNVTYPPAPGDASIDHAPYALTCPLRLPVLLLQGLVELKVAELRHNEAYMKFYMNWFRLVATGIFPFVALFYLNVNIYKKVMQSRYVSSCYVLLRIFTVVSPLVRAARTRAAAARLAAGGRHNQAQASPNAADGLLNTAQAARQLVKKEQQAVSKGDIGMATVLVGIVIIFVCCHLPR